MNKTALLLASMLLPAAAFAQSFVLQSGGVNYVVPTADAGQMVFTSDSTLQVCGMEYNINALDLLYITADTFDMSAVKVDYAGEKATVTVPCTLAQYLTVSVSGADVSIIQEKTVAEDTSGEITYILAGQSSAGSFYAEGSYKASYQLNGLNLTNPAGAAIDIQNGKRIKLKVNENTENFLVDGANGKQKGALVVKGHLEIAGKGALTVSGNTSHAIYAKEYITLKNATVTVDKSVKDGLNCNQYFSMESGTLTIDNVGDDGIQVSYKDDADREEEDTGSITIAGGKLHVATTAAATKAVKADAFVYITGGEIDAQVSGSGIWDDAKSKTKAAACFSGDEGIEITGGKVVCRATGGGGKGFNTDSAFHLDGGNVEISTSGGVFAYVNGTIYDNYTGSTDRLDSSLKSSAKGVKADGGVIIDSGSISVTTSGRNAEGIESKDDLTINGGEVFVKAYDDAINSAKNMYLNGGNVTVISINNDGLDSNGNLYMNGGLVRAFGSGSPECGIDANEEEGYTVVFTGGTLIGVGGGNSYPRNSETTQAYISLSASVKAGDTVTVYSGDELLATIEIPAEYSGTTSSGGMGGWGGSRGGSMLITCPGLEASKSYTVKYGSSSTTATARLTGSSSGPGGGGWPR